MSATPQLPSSKPLFQSWFERIALTLAVLLIGVLSARAQHYKYLSFPSPKYGYGVDPVGTPVQDEEGNLYGTALEGGDSNNSGTVFELTVAGKAKVLHKFSSENGDGYRPFAGVILDAAGNLYGTTYAGGAGAEAGTVFKVDQAGSETVFYSFQGTPDGANPVAPLVLDPEGNLYGTTESGGSFDDGTVFKVDPFGDETVLYSFQGGSDGRSPQAGLVRDTSGNLYGTTATGGASQYGTVFKLDPLGTETVLYSFQGGTDGASPLSNLIQDSSGILYGTTSRGGNSCGTVFKLNGAGVETVIYRFTCGSDGDGPFGGLVIDDAGNLYGTTVEGGKVPCTDVFQNGCGTVYRVSQNGKETTLHTFDWTDGTEPQWSLMRDSVGNLFGYAGAGGSGHCGSHGEDDGCGVIFRITK
jgi:uncharacterized repeat protein (TIGR03803 family)